VVAGDFNESPDGAAIRTMKQFYKSAYELRHGREPIATFPTALYPTPNGWTGCLDYIFLSPNITHIHHAAIFCDKPADDDDTLYPSDHVGLLVTVEL
jgi:endonuclease/exonuclease/phosphatase family metal-dependent hydrolase